MYLRVYVHIHWFADFEEYVCLCAPVFHYPVCSNAGVHDRTCIHIGTHIWSYLISFVYVYIPAVFHHHGYEISKHLIVCNKWTYRTKCLCFWKFAFTKRQTVPLNKKQPTEVQNCCNIARICAICCCISPRFGSLYIQGTKLSKK